MSQILYIVYDAASDVELSKFIGDGNVDQYPEQFKQLAEIADTGRGFATDLDGTRHDNVQVRSIPYDEASDN